MAIVRLWNDNYDLRTKKGYPLTQDFRGRKIHIEPNQYIEIEEDEAEDFRGTYQPIVVDGSGNHLPQGFKILRIEKLESAKKEPERISHNCHVCSYKGSSAEDLQFHCDENHLEQLDDPKVAEARKRVLERKLNGKSV